MIETWSRGQADANMPEAILTDQAALVRRPPWWLARARLILAALRKFDILPPSRILDAGCGWGVTLDSLERAGYAATGMDVSRQALEMLEADKKGDHDEADSKGWKRGPWNTADNCEKVMRKSASGKMNAENLGKLIENDDDTDTGLEAD